jgi:glycosyltransferase involved in cell wall biosynthesis
MGSRPVSLLLISYSYPPVLGGSEIEAQRVCAALLRRGHRVKVLCAGGAPMPNVADWTDPSGVPVRIFARRWGGPRRDYLFALGVAWALWKERRNYQLVYFLMQGLHLAVGLPVARALGKAIVIKISGSSIITMMRQTFLGRLELDWLKKWAYRVMILNAGMAEEAAAAGFRPSHLLWMPNPVDTSEFTPVSAGERRALRAQLHIPDRAAVLIYVGRLAPEKELPSLLRAFAAVRQRVPGALLTIVGEGPDREALTMLTGRLELTDSVRFTGRQTIAEVRQWLQAADVFALVSSAEGFPCSLVEAMAVALPAVVSSIPANLQLIDAGVHGLHAALRDEQAIAAALVELLSDPALRARMGEAARRRVVENYSMDKVLDRYEALFYEALGRPRERVPC